MGYALADAAARRGAHVILISGPTELHAPAEIDWLPVRSTEEMHRAVRDRASAADVVIMAAAVADYRPASPESKKIKRGAGKMMLELEPTADILAELGRNKGSTILVGFAAETDNLAENARHKLAAKGADIIVANDVTREGAGFDTDTNIVTLFSRDGREIALPKMSKFNVANRILDRVAELRLAQLGKGVK
jgi:phosphopantothenoylcysteine decarboxylase/phosphopantothenate--cysteine ligase